MGQKACRPLRGRRWPPRPFRGREPHDVFGAGGRVLVADRRLSSPMFINHCLAYIVVTDRTYDVW
jgi:hypothetical protein